MGILGDAVSGFSNFVEQKPEQFAIMADMLGRGFDPKNAFAGIGTMMGKSSLANKALAEDKKERMNFKELLARIISGEEPLTTADQPGLTSATIKPGKEGGTSLANLSVTVPSDKYPIKKPEENKVNLGGLISDPF